MILSKKALQQIKTEAKKIVGSRQIRLELSKKCNVGHYYDLFINLLENPTPETTDLYDFIEWKSVFHIDIPLVKGFMLLDFYVRDTDELKDNLIVLIDSKGSVVKTWITHVNKDELFEIMKRPKAVSYLDGYVFIEERLAEPFKEGQTFLSKEGVIHTNYGWNYGDRLVVGQTINLNIDNIPYMELDSHLHPIQRG